ncbi:hypothetical protein [uncultured Hymenobacter sp.]|uniref:hypothetical protein n=1 Tax=uncultured Hymenobacter sp. TaxID=170016 RepID=UPI0035C9D06F
MTESNQLAVAKTIKDEMEQRTGIQTKGVHEWVRVMLLACVKLEIDYSIRKMNVEANSKQVLEILTREYLLVGLKKGGVAE